MTDKRHVTDSLPAYALGCLDREDELRIDRHLSQCDSCSKDLASYEKVVDLFYVTAREVDLPLSLKKRVVRGIRSKAREARKIRVLHPGGWFSALKMAPAMGTSALILMMVLLAGNILLWRQVKQFRTIAMEKETHFVTLLGMDAAPNAHGYIYISDDGGQGTLIAEDLFPLDGEHQYQVWLIDNGKRTSGGVFSVTEEGYGSLQIFASKPLATYTSFGVSIEPAGGSVVPTGMKVLGVTPAE